jgi:hypothetical protein
MRAAAVDGLWLDVSVFRRVMQGCSDTAKPLSDFLALSKMIDLLGNIRVVHR